MLSTEEDVTDVDQIFKSNKFEKLYSSESNFIHHSLPYWRAGMEQKPLYTDITWLGSKIPKYLGPSALNGFRDYIINSESYQAVNIKIDEYKPLLPLPYP